VSRDDYRLMSRLYYALESVYGGGAMQACKASQAELIRPGDRVLYCGIGRGREAVLAAKKGAIVTGVDRSPSMLGRARREAEAAGVPIELIEGDVRTFDRPGAFDVVVTNFFLNVFEQEEMISVLRHVATLAKEGGRVLIADFAPLSGRGIGRLLQSIYWNLPLYTFLLMTDTQWHPIYDYPRFFDRAGLRLETARRFPIFRVGPQWYWTMAARREPAGT
jgi:demethylmenaquinone methyltransferase/2-methoxy-6-polyprenyl-1,4-benzoquinol methylase